MKSEMRFCLHKIAALLLHLAVWYAGLVVTSSRIEGNSDGCDGGKQLKKIEEIIINHLETFKQIRANDFYNMKKILHFFLFSFIRISICMK